MPRISSNFDAGSIEVLDASNPAEIRLALRADTHAAFRQWFHFRLDGVRDEPCRIGFVNAAEAAYPDGWRDYCTVASYDRQHWFRIPGTDYDGTALTVAFTPEQDAVWLAYFEPYSHERHLDLVARAQTQGARLETLGSSIEGRDIDLVSAGTGSRSAWVIARQHPGETMAQWCAEGLLQRLLDPADAVARRLLQRARIHVVPNMNPDGAVRGNLRTNAAGTNLNRAWAAPSLETSPEVWHVRERMQRTGVDLFLDLHGDEVLPYVFVDGCGMLPGFTPEQAAREAAFVRALRAASPEFQTAHGYAPDRFTDELLTLASKHVGHRYGCLALTLEMPFKDNAELPDPRHGWSAARSRGLGAALLPPMLDALDAC
jgi:murein tripeptide amidase MpaA